MESIYCYEITPVISVFLLFILLFSPHYSLADANNDSITFESNKMKFIEATLKKINKPFVKSIKSPDGDIIDCVLIHFQPAFNNPALKVTMPLDPPEIPYEKKKGIESKDANKKGINSQVKQLWNSNGESCPHGTIPIRRTTENDILRSNSISKFGKKVSTTNSETTYHEYGVGYVKDGQYYGARANLNVWAPNVNVTRHGEFSLSQIWVAADVPGRGVNTLEAGWQVYPNAYGDKSPRAFIYWTNDDYRSGCYNLLCSGFVQTTHEISLGAAISPTSTYNGQQFEIIVLIWKDPKKGNWWLKIGNIIVGYWPVALFPDLKHATMIEYGGEVVNNPIDGSHTSTQMGSGHFPNEKDKKASYVRNMEFVDENNRLNPVGDVTLIADKPNCYDVRKGFDRDGWGYYLFFGGPGYNPDCP